MRLHLRSTVSSNVGLFNFIDFVLLQTESTVTVVQWFIRLYSEKMVGGC
jgi:hypothetical protein